MTDEEKKAAQEKAEAEAKEKEKAEAEAKEREKKVKIENGVVTLSEQDYNNLVNMKDDMLTYKEAKRKAEKELEEKKAADLKEKEEQQIKDKEFEDLFEKEKQKNIDLVAKFKNQKINHALAVKAIEAGIKKGEYIKLVDKSTIKMDDDTGEITGVDEIVESFKKDNPDLFGSNEPPVPGVDTGQGGKKSGVYSDDELLKLKAPEIMRIKKEDPATYKRWSDLATHGQPIPERNKDKEEKTD